MSEKMGSGIEETDVITADPVATEQIPSPRHPSIGDRVINSSLTPLPTDKINSTMSSPLPTFVLTLLNSPPRPSITPGHIQANGGYTPSVASDIVNALFHPALEAALHLLNGDLYSAHFIVRKMQNDQYGMWLHGILHRYEGDYSNAKAWYMLIDEDLLKVCPIYASSSKTGAHSAAYNLIDRTAMLPSKSLSTETLFAQYEERKIPAPPAPTETSLVEMQTRMISSQSDSLKEAEEQAWQEITWLTKMLGGKFGWQKGVDGSEAYTESTEEQKDIMRRMQSGGEGIRKF